MAIDVDHQVAVYETKGYTKIAFCDKCPDDLIEIAWKGEDEFATCGPKGIRLWKVDDNLKGKTGSLPASMSKKCASIATFKN